MQLSGLANLAGCAAQGLPGRLPEDTPLTQPSHPFCTCKVGTAVTRMTASRSGRRAHCACLLPTLGSSGCCSYLTGEEAEVARAAWPQRQQGPPKPSSVSKPELRRGLLGMCAQHVSRAWGRDPSCVVAGVPAEGSAPWADTLETTSL